MILGYPWLHDHNPEVDWQMQKVTLSRCPAQCHTFQTELHKEQREEVRIRAIRAGPLLCLVEDEAKDTGEPDDDEPFLELGDRLFATVSIPNVPISVITASGTTAQQLAE